MSDVKIPQLGDPFPSGQSLPASVARDEIMLLSDAAVDQVRVTERDLLDGMVVRSYHIIYRPPGSKGHEY